MTSPEDDGLEEALRRALSEAASEVEPGGDGLDKIHARIGGRPPRHWLLSVILGVVERVRYWTWRGHWTWPTSLPKIPGLRGTRSRRSNFPGWGFGSLRLAVVLAGIAVIAAATLGIQPFRHAILQASAALNGDSGPQQVSARTEGNGARAIEGGSGTPAAGGGPSGGGQAGAGPTPSAAASSRPVKPHPAATAKCAPTTTSSVTKGAQSSLTDVTPQVSVTTPSTEVTAPLVPSPAASAQPHSTSTATCPVASPTASPTPTPTSSSSSPVPTPWATSPTPTYTDPSPWSTAPTADPSPRSYDRPSPSGPPFPSRPDRERGMPSYHAPRRR
jgi:hypothetical protein